MTLAQDTSMAAAICGSRGTINWATGIGPGTKVEVLEYGDDYILVARWDTDERWIVPLHAIRYYKFAGEDD